MQYIYVSFCRAWKAEVVSVKMCKVDIDATYLPLVFPVQNWENELDKRIKRECLGTVSNNV